MRKLVMILILLFLPLTGCAAVCNSPESGVWYCEELGLTINCDEPKQSYLEIDGTRILCYYCHDDHGASFWVVCGEENAAGIREGKKVFSGWNVQVSEGQWVVRQSWPEEQYTFILQQHSKP